MDEKDRAKQLNDLLDDLLADRPVDRDASSEDLLRVAGRLAGVRDLGHRSRSRNALRRKLLSEFPGRDRSPSSFRFVFRAASFGALLLIVIVGLDWLLSGAGRLPDPAAAPTGTAAAETATPLPVDTEQGAAGAMALPAPLTMDSDSETIRLRLLDSYIFWQRLWVDARLDDLAPGRDGPVLQDLQSGDLYSFPGVYSQRVQVWLEQPILARALIGPFDGAPMENWVSEAVTVELYIPPRTETGVIDPHPMGSLVPTPIRDLLFPSGLAQRGGTYTPVGVETMAGREALVVDWTAPWGEVVDRFWVDSITGVILRQLNVGKDRGGIVTADYRITAIVYDLTFHPATFDRNVEMPAEFVTGPEFIYTSPPPAAASGEPDLSPAAGEIYLLLTTSQTFETAGMVHFPASCLLTRRPCPEPAAVDGLPQGFGFGGMNWSPDGSKLVYPVSHLEDSIWIFDRLSLDWIRMDVSYLSGVVWSPDGSRLAGEPIVPGDARSNSIVWTGPDGLEWFNLMGGLPGFKTPAGWLDNDRLLFINTLDNEISPESPTLRSEIQLYEFASGEVSVIAAHEWPGEIHGPGFPYLSPDRSRIAYSLEENGVNQAIVIDLADGDRTVFPIQAFTSIAGWSPDGEDLVLTGGLGSTCEIRLVPVEGGDDRLVYAGNSGGGCQFAWSPDGAYLLVPEIAFVPTVPRLTVIALGRDTDLGQQWTVELPGVGVEFAWPRAAWLP